ncbi:MAG: NYN domain-containing protein [Thermoguttaceae bacterium]
MADRRVFALGSNHRKAIFASCNVRCGLGGKRLPLSTKLSFAIPNAVVRRIPSSPMPLLIDGYNLLYAAGIVGRGGGPGGLERSRLALLNFLAHSLDPTEASRTCIVFDAHDAPRGLPRTVVHRGLTVRYAVGYPTADALIQEIIQAESAPRRLVVVSSDREIQRAARRRRAKAVSSEAWYEELLRRRRERREAAAETPERPLVPLLQEDVEYWIRQFGGESLLKEWERPTGGEPFNPFPPGYGEDLEREQ